VFVRSSKNLCGIMILVCALSAGEASVAFNDLQNWLSSESNSVPETAQELDDLTVIMVQRNPDIQAASLAYQAALSMENTIVSLPDPLVSVGIFGRPVETANGPQQMKLGISQKIPLPGKTRALKAQYSARTQMAAQSLNAVYLEKLRGLRALWNEGWFLQRSISLQEEKLNLIQDHLGILDNNYRGGLISHSALIQAQMDLKLVENNLENTKAEQDRLAIRLGRLLGLDAPFHLPEAISRGVRLDATQQGLVVAAHPLWIRLEQYGADRAAGERLARANLLPDITLGLEYLVIGSKDVAVPPENSGRDALALSIGTQIPIWNWKQKRAEVRASQVQKLQADLQLASEGDHLREAYALALSTWKENQRTIAVYENELIPRSREQALVTQQGYITETSTISELIQAQVEVVNLQLALAKQHKAANDALIDLKYLRSE
jgi:cobalt-zinc-cadmium efflux system outer membrane protein